MIGILTGLAAAMLLQSLKAQSAPGLASASAPGVSTNAPADPAAARAGKPPLFAALDSNHDGVIDADEIAAAPRSLAVLDKNKDGKLSAEEIMPVRGASMLLIALDVNRDGTIDETELANATTELRLLDKDHNGKLTADEVHAPKRELPGGSSSSAAPGGQGQK